jgi:hypothetical protein
MTSSAQNVNEYVENLPASQKEALVKLREIILAQLPEGFVEQMNYGMIGYVVPHNLYPAGYHCDTKLPLPFLGLAAQKNFIALYHMGIYASPALLTWFQEEYPKHSKTKLDMGKSCMRFKKVENIPYQLIGELVGKMTVSDWIALYEQQLRK